MTMTQLKCDVKDMSLAEQGLNNIQWAMKDMPVLEQIKKRLSETKVYMMAYYPASVKGASHSQWPDAAKTAKRRLDMLADANKAVEELAVEFGYKYIDVNAGLTDEDGQTKEEFSIDGIHMWSDAYEIVYNNMKKYILE